MSIQDTHILEFDELETDTDEATLLLVDDKRIWIPNTYIYDITIKDNSVEVEVSDWWIEKEGLDQYILTSDCFE